ncbi:F-box protein [Phanerochaete sordida]|uniref:F-box protein n=1 Tax=Phanerochaete sordida TaxID=48140 RepID=A0A9P3FZV9_9APHY|nr:F-box protein [Phanerochaete sordida]
MAWDELCVLCGIRPTCGPTWLQPNVGQLIKAEAIRIASELSPPAQDHADVVARLEAALALTSLTEEIPGLEARLRLGTSGDCLAVGHFAPADGAYAPCTHHGAPPRHPAGDGAAVRRVRDGDSGMFWQRVLDADARTLERCTTCCRTHYDPLCNVWVHVECAAYLEAWLDCDAPPRVGRDGKPLALLAELYELANSRREPRAYGSLPCVDYGAARSCFLYNEQHQDYVLPARNGTKYTARALAAGLVGKELLPAILEDCRFWTFIRPDIWPTRLSEQHGKLDVATSGPESQQSTIARLPLELLAEILQYLELPSLLTFALSCKGLYTRTLDHSMLSHCLRHSMVHADGAMRWLFPVSELPGEYERAYSAMMTWIPWDVASPLNTQVTFNDALFEEEEDDGGEFVPSDDNDDTSDIDNIDGSDDSDVESADTDVDEGIAEGTILDVPVPPPPPHQQLPRKPLPLFDPGFPLLAFLRACYTDDSMRARRRRWGLIKQFDKLWTDYRRDGWERDVFAPVGVTWKLGAGWELVCDCEG